MQSSSVRSSTSPLAAASEVPSVATLVTAGTHEERFHRLEHAVADLAARGALAAPVLIQTGADNAELDLPESVTAVDFLEPGALEALMRSARYVVTHGGPGSIFMALEAGHRPIAVGRSAAHGEHVDDHQRTFVRAMGERGLVHALDEPGALGGVASSLGSTRERQTTQFVESEPMGGSFVDRFALIADSLAPADLER
jgi:UDP-N-acetylglucosamine transferase subunit ALG13